MSATFYLGIHNTRWLGIINRPTFISRNRAAHTKLRSWPRARAGYALDSGGFTELSRHGRWRIDEATYVEFVRALHAQCGEPDFVAPMDHMCEPFILSRTGRTLSEHLHSTVDNFAQLRRELGALVIPVLQGYGPRDYDRCYDLYTEAGFDLTRERLVGVGSVCRRSGSSEANRLLRYIADRGLRLHAFGIKGSTWKACRSFLASADSMAWSLAARKQGRDGNSLAEAMLWRDRTLRA